MMNELHLDWDHHEPGVTLAWSVLESTDVHTVIKRSYPTALFSSRGDKPITRTMYWFFVF